MSKKNTNTRWKQTLCGCLVAITFIGATCLVIHLQTIRKIIKDNFHPGSSRQLRNRLVLTNDTQRILTKHSNVRRKVADSMWTAKPENQNYFETKLGISSKNSEIDFAISAVFKGKSHKDTSANIKQNNTMLQLVNEEVNTPSVTDNPTSPVTTSSDTTPILTDRPTRPITTVSETTPIYTEQPTSPITTESVTTPILTEPGGDIEITTESDDPNETYRLVRLKRGVARESTTPKPEVCEEGTNSYNGHSGKCQCNMGWKETYCEREMGNSEVNKQKNSSLVVEAEPDGQYTDKDRKYFQAQLEAEYKDIDGFERIFVHQPVYNATTNTTKLLYRVFFSGPVAPDDTDNAATMTYDIIRRSRPIVIGGTNVTFGENRTLIRDSDNNEVLVNGNVDVCYVYKSVDACQNGGTCYDNNGEPACKCADGFYDQFCSSRVNAPETTDEDILTVLLPIMAAVAALTSVCCCVLFFLRGVNKGDEETVSSTDYSWREHAQGTVILPRYHRPHWKQMLPGPEMEESEASVSAYEVYLSDDIAADDVSVAESEYVYRTGHYQEVPYEENLNEFDPNHARLKRCSKQLPNLDYYAKATSRKTK